MIVKGKKPFNNYSLKNKCSFINKMNFFLEKAGRLWVVIIAFLLGLVLVYYVIKPKVLEPLGLVGTNNCLKIIYKTIGDTALIYVDPINRWFWFNDKKVYVYGEMGGRYCKNTAEFEPVYVLDASRDAGYVGEGEGYECIRKLEEVLDYYTKNKGSWNSIIHCLKKDRAVYEQILTVQQVINILLEKRIIFN